MTTYVESITIVIRDYTMFVTRQQSVVMHFGLAIKRSQSRLSPITGTALTK